MESRKVVIFKDASKVRCFRLRKFKFLDSGDIYVEFLNGRCFLFTREESMYFQSNSAQTELESDCWTDECKHRFERMFNIDRGQDGEVAGPSRRNCASASGKKRVKRDITSYFHGENNKVSTYTIFDMR